MHALKSNDDPHGEIVRLEEHIDELAAKMESCRKFILVSRIATAGGGFVLAAMLLGAIRFDPPQWRRRSRRYSAAWSCGGSNGSTAKEAAKELAMDEADRAALIEKADLRVING